MNDAPPIPRLREETRKEHIARAALKLAEDGLPAVTVTAVAEAVGLVPSALYRHFENREAMIRAAFLILRARLFENLQKAQDDPEPMEALNRFWHGHLRMIREHGAIPRILFSEDLAAPGSPVRALLVEGQDTLLAGVAGIIAQGQEGGVIRADLDPRDLAILFMGQILLPAHMFFIRRGNFDIEAQVGRCWAIFSDMLRPRPAKEA
jgi:AcrR family transcriptional regulator